jgi:hypothetical protein
MLPRNKRVLADAAGLEVTLRDLDIERRMQRDGRGRDL